MEGQGVAISKMKRQEIRRLKEEPSGVCRVCGCTESCPCDPPCRWADKKRTICSKCR